MTIEELFSSVNVNTRKQRREEEHRIQCACVKWFRAQYRCYDSLLFAVPNGGVRDKVTAAKLKAEGVVPGVSDLILLVPSGKYHGLMVEMKTPTGHVTEHQKAWASAVSGMGYRYAVCRSTEDFITTVRNYLNNG